MLARALVFVVLGATTSVIGADASTRLVKEAVPILKCVYRALSSDKATLSVDAYVVDDFRAAIEFRFRDRESNEVTGHAIFTTTETGTTYEIREDPYKGDGFEELDFFSRAIANPRTLCRVKSAGDLLLPGMAPRHRWRWVDLSKET